MAPTTRDVVGELRGSTLSSVITPRSLSLLLFGLIGFVLFVLSPFLFETNNAGFYAVKQAAGTGTLSARTEPGMFIQGFGDVTRYKQSDTLHFEEGGLGAIDVRFTDGAKAKVAVNVRFDLPNDPVKLLDIHQKFRSYNALVSETIRQVVSESVLLTAALMNTEESYTTKRAEFSQIADDQVRNGVYITEAEAVETKDKKTGEVTLRHIVSIQKDSTGKPERKHAVLDQYGIRVTQFVITDIDYDEKVDGMIAAKQEAMQQTVSAKANAERAAQDRLTAEEVGKKNVAVATYEQEVEKAKAIKSAEKELEVAKLGRLSAEQNKLAKIAQGEGEGEYRRKVMIADGALEQKLRALEKIHEHWANALANSKNPIVPAIVMDGGPAGAGAGNGINQFMQLMGAQAAKQLAVDVGAKSSN
jgi:hypothetical protein